MKRSVSSRGPATVQHQSPDSAGTRCTRLRFTTVVILWGLGLCLGDGGAGLVIPIYVDSTYPAETYGL
jgi:hypothetical protein